jgi:hypothetical protein
MSRLLFFAAACLVAGLSACAPARQYAGPARPQSQVARLVVFADGAQHFGRGGDVRYDGKIVSVDGAPARTRTGIVEVLPGRHEVTVCWQRFEVPCWGGLGSGAHDNFMVAESGNTSFQVDAEAGKRYRLRWPFANEVGPPLGFFEHN